MFGDPHYRTFDGKFFSFKGACKYQLASDCSGHTFSVRVTNDARSTRFSAWTKTIAIKVSDNTRWYLEYRVSNLSRETREPENQRTRGNHVRAPHDGACRCCS